MFTGDLPANHEILREISSLCDQLPVLDNKLFEKDFCSVSFLSCHNSFCSHVMKLALTLGLVLYIGLKCQIKLECSPLGGGGLLHL